jgi:hypothetical protein
METRSDLPRQAQPNFHVRHRLTVDCRLRDLLCMFNSPPRESLTPSSRNEVSFSSGGQDEASTVPAIGVCIQIVRPFRNPLLKRSRQLQPALLRLSAIIFLYRFTHRIVLFFALPHVDDKAIDNLFHTATSINVRRIFAGIAQLVRAADL